MKATKTKTPLTLADVQRRASIFDRYFSIEQQAQINRLQSAGDFEGETESEAVEKTIATLAAAGLWILGLDTLSQDAFCRLAEVVFGNEANAAYNRIVDVIGNDAREAGEKWTLRQRAAELGEVPLKGRAA